MLPDQLERRVLVVSTIERAGVRAESAPALLDHDARDLLVTERDRQRRAEVAQGLQAQRGGGVGLQE